MRKGSGKVVAADIVKKLQHLYCPVTPLFFPCQAVEFKEGDQHTGPGAGDLLRSGSSIFFPHEGHSPAGKTVIKEELQAFTQSFKSALRLRNIVLPAAAEDPGKIAPGLSQSAG